MSKKVGIEVLGVIVRDEAKKVAAWLEEYGNPYRAIVSDWGHVWYDDMGLRWLHETLVVLDGTVTHHWVGPITDDAISSLEKLLDGNER